MRKAETQNKPTEEQKGFHPAPAPRQPRNMADVLFGNVGCLFTKDVTGHPDQRTDSSLPGSRGPQELAGYLRGPAHCLTPQMPLDIFWRVG